MENTVIPRGTIFTVCTNEEDKYSRLSVMFTALQDIDLGGLSQDELAVERFLTEKGLAEPSFPCYIYHYNTWQLVGDQGLPAGYWEEVDEHRAHLVEVKEYRAQFN